MNNIIYPTMDALSYARIQSLNTGYNLHGYGNFGYQATDIPVSMPTECPCCNKIMASDLTPIIAVNNLPLSDFAENDEHDNIKEGSKCNVVSVYRCTSCNSLFSIWSNHTAIMNKQNEIEWSCETLNIFPFDTNISIFSKEITTLSKEFVTIYNQSELAEAQNLDKICGMGYRRALEFLIDAYIRKNKPTETIDFNLELSKKINNYIDSPKIKTLAKKSVWLGNDATHIINKHPNRTIQYIKKFIKAITTMIDAEFAFEDADTIERG